MCQSNPVTYLVSMSLTLHSGHIFLVPALCFSCHDGFLPPPLFLFSSSVCLSMSSSPSLCISQVAFPEPAILHYMHLGFFSPNLFYHLTFLHPPAHLISFPSRLHLPPHLSLIIPSVPHYTTSFFSSSCARFLKLSTKATFTSWYSVCYLLPVLTYLPILPFWSGFFFFVKPVYLNVVREVHFHLPVLPQCLNLGRQLPWHLCCCYCCCCCVQGRRDLLIHTVHLHKVFFILFIYFIIRKCLKKWEMLLFGGYNNISIHSPIILH